MDEIVYTLIVAVVCAVVSFAIGWTKRKGWDLKAEDLYSKYKLLFDISGNLIQTIDPTLYQEMKEAVEKMTEAYQSTSFTPDMFNEIVKECKDVFDRAQTLLGNRTETEESVTEPAETTK